MSIQYRGRADRHRPFRGVLMTERFNAPDQRLAAPRRTLPERLMALSPWGLFPYWLVRRGVLLGVRVAVFDDRNGVFLVRHTYVPGWHFPGGGVDSGETIADAARRELHEEGGLEAGDDLQMRSIHINRQFFDRDHVCFFTTHVPAQAVSFTANHEIAECGFFPRDALPQGTSAATLRRLHELDTEAAPDPYW